MGKQRRLRRQRGEQGSDPFAAAVAPFMSASLLPVFEAAAASPTAAHRGLSIASLLNAVVRHRPHGTRQATAADLPTMLQGLPDLSGQEDFAPYDARDEVLVRWGDELFRVLAGSLERPSARLNQQALLAAAIDPVLVPRLGFGLGDVGELILRRVDDVARALAVHWPTGPAATPGDPASITEAEIEAARNLPLFDDLPDRCSHPDRAMAAATCYTMALRDLAPPSAYSPATFGTAIASRSRGRVRPLPAAYLVEALPVIGRELAGQAAAADPAAQKAFTDSVWIRVANRFKGSAQLIGGPVRMGSSSPLHSFVIHNGRQVIALNVVAGLTPETFSSRLQAGDEALRRVVPDVGFTTAASSHTLPNDAQIVRAHVIAWPHPEFFLDAQYPVLTLEDLEWILYTARQASEDLWYFLRDLANPVGVESMFAWDMIDRWEVWREEKSFYRGGTPLNHLMFAPHQAVEEWRESATTAPIERALLALGLRPLRDWPVVVPDHRNGTEVADLSVDEVWQVLPLPVPAAVAKTDPSGPRERGSDLWRFAVSVAWKLDRCAEAFQVAATMSEITSLRVVFTFREREDGPPLTVEHVGDSVIAIGWDTRLQAALAEDSFSVERLAGELVAEVLHPSTRTAFVQAWEAAPPGIRVDGFRLKQQVHWLPDPIVAHDSVRADVLRGLGEFLAAEGVESGLLEGADATQFESRTVFPWLMARLHEAIAGLSADALLEFALGQLERVQHQRSMRNMRLGWELGFPTASDSNRSDDIARVSEQIRVISLIVEEVLAHPPVGDGAVDAATWIEVISVADLCFSSCIRSATIHNHLTRTAARVTNNYEVQTLLSDEPTDIDYVRYQRLRSKHTLPAPIPIATGQTSAPDDDEQPSPPISERVPRLAPIDTVLRSTLGFGIDAMLGLLQVATQWEASQQRPATLTTPTALVDECVRLVAGVERIEFATALEWLTLRGQDLAADVIPHWETERRAKRVLTSPFVASNDKVWILPWTTEAACKIFVNYLSDGRLPRPQVALPGVVNTVLNQFRQEQNRDAERECTAALGIPGLVVRSGVKPEKKVHYGITQLSGEIDTLCVDPARSRIWVIEVKDSYTPYSSHQVRQLVDRFNKSGKYVDRLLAKVSDIEESASSLATALKVPESDRQWVVLGLMVTRHLEPAALTVDAKVPYCILADVLEVVTQDTAPGPGLHGPSAEIVGDADEHQD